MRLVTFRDRDPAARPRIGALSRNGQSIIDLAATAQAMDGRSPDEFRDMLALLDGGERAMAQAARAVQWATQRQPAELMRRTDEITLLAPVPRPLSIRDCMAFERHVIQCMRAIARRRAAPVAALDRGLERLTGRGFLRPPAVWYERPIYYKGNPHTVVGPEAEVRWPSYATQLDYELEFGIYIGRRGRDIPASQAASFIAGFTIFNDVSARDTQGREMCARLGPAKGKDFDTGNVMGPCLVTPDEVPDPYALTMIARVNDEEWSRGTSGGMTHRFDEIIAFISRDETLHPGEFIGSGAVGDGCGLELGRWIQPGDVVELEVDGLGRLRNRIAAPPKKEAQGRGEPHPPQPWA